MSPPSPTSSHRSDSPPPTPPPPVTDFSDPSDTSFPSLPKSPQQPQERQDSVPLELAPLSEPSSILLDLNSPILQSSSIPPPIPWADAPNYAQRFKSSLRNLKKMSDPVSSDDGIPVVRAPKSILLQTAQSWKGHIFAQFHGLIPPPAKIFADLNPVWGKHGNITIRSVSDTTCLIFIPSVPTREWVLQVGYWQAGHCAFTVAPWSAEGNLEMQELRYAPTWAILKNVPPQMYSLDGISIIGSAIGEPLHTEKSRLDPFHLRDTKIKVEIKLDNPPPETVIVEDSQGNRVRIKVEYPRLPPKCVNCAKFGHFLNRCPLPAQHKRTSELQKVDISASTVSGTVDAHSPPSATLTDIKVQNNIEEEKTEVGAQTLVTTKAKVSESTSPTTSSMEKTVVSGKKESTREMVEKWNVGSSNDKSRSGSSGYDHLALGAVKEGVVHAAVSKFQSEPHKEESTDQGIQGIQGPPEGFQISSKAKKRAMRKLKLSEQSMRNHSDNQHSITTRGFSLGRLNR